MAGNGPKRSVPRWRNGRRAGFRYQWPQGRVGSSPSLGTIPLGSLTATPVPRWRNWYTRTFEGRMRQLIRVQVQAWAPPPLLHTTADRRSFFVSGPPADQPAAIQR